MPVVIPAKAGTQLWPSGRNSVGWIPAIAGMTKGLGRDAAKGFRHLIGESGDRRMSR